MLGWLWTVTVRLACHERADQRPWHGSGTHSVAPGVAPAGGGQRHALVRGEVECQTGDGQTWTAGPGGYRAWPQRRAEVHPQVAGLLGDPGAGGVGGDPGDVHAAAAVLDHDQGVDATQGDGVDVGEVDGEDRLGLRGEELVPGRPGPVRSGV